MVVFLYFEESRSNLREFGGLMQLLLILSGQMVLKVRPLFEIWCCDCELVPWLLRLKIVIKIGLFPFTIWYAVIPFFNLNISYSFKILSLENNGVVWSIIYIMTKCDCSYNFLLYYKYLFHIWSTKCITLLNSV